MTPRTAPEATAELSTRSVRRLVAAWALAFAVLVSSVIFAVVEGGNLGRVVSAVAGIFLSILILSLAAYHARVERQMQRMTRELADSRERLVRALGVTRDGVWEFDAQRDEFYCSDRLRIMLGLPDMEVSSLRKLLRCVRRPDRSRLVLGLRACLAAGEPLDESVQLAGPRGAAPRWMRVRALSQGQGGKVLRVTGAVSDVTPMIAQRRELEAFQAFLYGALDAMPVPLSVKDEDLRWVIVNAAYCEMEQRPAADFIGQRNRAIVDDELSARLEAMDRATLATGERQTECMWLTRPRSGERSYVRISKIRCMDQRGRPTVLSSFEDLTLLQQEQERHARLHDFYQQIFDALPHPVFVKDAQHRYIFTNRAHAESRGCSKEAIIGATSFDHAPQDVAHAINEAEDEIFQGTAPPMVEKEYTLVDPAGAPRQTVVRKVALRGLDGQPVLLGINTDITALRLMERDLRGALHRFSMLYENAPLGIALIGYRGNLLDANPYFLRMTGYTRDEIAQLTHRDLSPMREHPLDDMHAAELLAQGFCEAFEKHYLRKDGREVPVMVSGVVVREGERVTQVWGLVQDMSERNAALDAWRHSEARWQFALEGAGDGVWDWEVPTNKVFFSTRWKTMLGYAENEIGDMRTEFLSRLHPEDRAATEAAVQAHLDGLSPVYVSEFRLRCRDGRYKWILDRGKVITRSADGRPLRVIGTHTDITDRKEVEDEVRQHRDRLADLVREQTAGLVRAKEAAERALEAKSLFLANMSHELRTPMHAVLSFAKLGESRADKVPAEKLHDYFSRIHASGERLMNLLNDLLDLSKFEAGRMSIDLRPLDLGEVIAEVLHEYEAWVAAKRLRIELEIAPGVPSVRADHARMGQVLRNLLSNAIKFTPEARTIFIRLGEGTMPRGRRATDKGEVRATNLCVADQGPGIPPDELESVFEKFVQSTTTRTGAGGTGLGLAICREIVLAHRGRIFAHNLPAGGAEFVVQLPAESEWPEASGRRMSGELGT